MNRFETALARLGYSKFLWPLIWISGNRFSQRVMGVLLNICQHLMGVGTGSDVNTSGEKILPALIKKRLNPPYVIFDVGANVGDFTGLIARAFNEPDRIIHVFEPAFATYMTLTKALQGIKGLTVNNFGLAGIKGEATLYYDDLASGLASLTRRQTIRSQPFAKTETVQLITLDEYCEKHKIAKIDLLKMDVEGHELEVLQGAQQMFAKKAIKLVSLEFSGANVDTRTYVFDFFSFFMAMNMTLFRLTRSGYLYPINEYSEDLEQFRTTIFLAVQDRE